MNILVISSGNIVQLAKYPRWFAEQGHTVTFINPRWQNRLCGRTVDDEFGELGIQFKTWDRFNRFVHLAPPDFDVIFGTQHGTAEMVLKYQRLLEIPALLQILDIAGPDKPIQFEGQKDLVTTFPHITALTGINPAIPVQIEELTGRTDCHMVFYPTDTELLDSMPDLPTQEFVLIISRHADFKRVDLAIRACAHAGRKLRLICDQGRKNELSALAHSLGCHAKFQPRATDDMKARLLRQCKMHIFTQMWAEAPCIPSAEALYCNKPSIIWDYPAQRKIEGGFSRYIEPGNWAAMGDEINRVWNDYDKEVAFAKKGHLWVKENTAPSIVAQKILDILIDLGAEHA